VHVLALDTSFGASVAVLVDDEPRARVTETAPRLHVERLSPLIVEAMDSAGIKGDDVDRIVVGTGPAPFTGLRIGLVTARVLARAWGVPAYGVCSLDGLGAEHGGRATVVTDARRREVYWATYDGGERVSGPFVSSPGAVIVHGEVVGRGVTAYPEVFGVGEEGDAKTRLVDPDPAWLAHVADRSLARGETDLPTVPLYLRRPDTHGIAPS
jgi:tRNA threonylcarbamoyladenosine biosynthesis protein TsaB